MLRLAAVLGHVALPAQAAAETCCGVPTQIVRRFATDPRLKVALLSVTAAGTGLDISAASHVVFAELPHEVRATSRLPASLLLHRWHCYALTGI